MSYYAEIEMKNVDVINFRTDLAMGYLMVRETDDEIQRLLCHSAKS